MNTLSSPRLSKISGFTLAEVSVAIFIMGILFVGGLSLFVTSAQLSLKTHAASFATSDASNAVQRITNDGRHALYLALPSDPSTEFTPPPNTSTVSFSAWSQGQSVDTAVEMIFPNTAAATVQTGLTTTASDTVADRTTAAALPANALWIYRADSGGVPDAAGGQLLWMRGTERGTAVDRALLPSLNPLTPGAVQFVRPAVGSAVLPYQLKIKIVSAYYSLVGGTQTSDSTDGSALTALTGKNVLLRDHEQSLDHDPGAAAPAAVSPAPWLSN